MLVLSRRESESVVLQLEDGRHITVFVSVIEGRQVRLAFDAPATVKILRDDLLGHALSQRTS